MAEHPKCAKSASQTKITILFEETYVSDENALTKVRLTQRFRCQYNVPTPAARGATVHSGKRARHTDEWAAYLPWCGPGPQLERAGLVWAAGGVGLRAHAPPKETSAISATAVTLKNQLLPLGFLLRSQRKFDFLATYAHIFLFFLSQHRNENCQFEWVELAEIKGNLKKPLLLLSFTWFLFFISGLNAICWPPR